MNLNKHKIATGIFNYIINSKSDPNIPVQEKTSEKEFIDNILKENYESIKIHPPEHILHYMKIKSSAEAGKFSPFQNIFMHLRPSILAPVVIIFISIFILWKPREKRVSLPLATIGREFVNINPAYILEKNGIQLSTSRAGTIAIENKGPRDNIFMKQGSWFIETQHNLFEKETWFHFPGGGVKPIGTNISIDISPNGTKVTLKKGKIQTYFINKSRRLEKSTIESAPFSYDFPPGIGIVSFQEGDSLTQQADEIVKFSEADQKDKLAEENSSVYENFIGATISVIHGNGSRISGVLEYVYGGKLNIKTKTGIVEVIGNDMTLVSLDVTNSNSENSSMFREKK